MLDDPTLEQYLRAKPTDEETAQKAVRPYRALDVVARLDAMVALLRHAMRLLHAAVDVTRVLPSTYRHYRAESGPQTGAPSAHACRAGSATFFPSGGVRCAPCPISLWAIDSNIERSASPLADLPPHPGAH